jgi:hypothetical protein
MKRFMQAYIHNCHIPCSQITTCNDLVHECTPVTAEEGGVEGGARDALHARGFEGRGQPRRLLRQPLAIGNREYGRAVHAPPARHLTSSRELH